MLYSNSLINFGFNPSLEAQRLNSLPTHERSDYHHQQLESYINHLAKDEAVSILYKYWIDNNAQIYTSPYLSEVTNVKYQIDPHERNGLFYQGISSAIKIAKETPNNLVALYSPIGKRLFAETPVDDVDPDTLALLKKPYTDGQLYFLYYDGQKINNVAVGINSDKNPWLKRLSEDVGRINENQNGEARISEFLLTPLALGNLDEFFRFWIREGWKNDHLIYTNQSGKKYYLGDVILEMQKTFAGQKTQYVEVYNKTTEAMTKSQVTALSVRDGYLFVLKNFMRLNGLSTLPLGGGCGGAVVNSSVLEEILGANSPFSSQFRALKQGKDGLLPKKDYKNDPNLCKCGKPQEAHFHCPGKNEKKEDCLHPIIVGEGTTRCKSCGLAATCN